MSKHRGSPRFLNPFYLLVLVSGTLFAVTCLAYLISPMVIEQSRPDMFVGRVPASVRAALWIDRNGATLIAYETGLLTVSALAAMAFDRLFTNRTDSKS